MSEFKVSYLEIEPAELVGYLLRESGQVERNSVNPIQILDCLKLDCELIDLKTVFPPEIVSMPETLRAMLSFPDKLIAIDSSLSKEQLRFSVLHEIAHYTLPSHQYTFYLCNDKGMGFSTQLLFEKEANEFAANLLFMGDRFTLEANSQKICAATVKLLAEKYEASFVATARRLAEKNFKPCMLIVFKRKSDRSSVDSDYPLQWEVHYCFASASFKTQYFTRLSGLAPLEVVIQLTKPEIDITNSICKVVQIASASGEPSHFDAEFFTNKYNIFAFLLPKQ